jgi:hypothetical protein
MFHVEHKKTGLKRKQGISRLNYFESNAEFALSGLETEKMVSDVPHGTF